MICRIFGHIFMDEQIKSELEPIGHFSTYSCLGHLKFQIQSTHICLRCHQKVFKQRKATIDENSILNCAYTLGQDNCYKPHKKEK